MENFPKNQPETKEQLMKRLMGLRDFPLRTVDEKRALLGSDSRVFVLDAISTTTNPASKREIKKGIVLEVTEKGLIPEEVLKHNPIVYIGSGTDVEYPLALGGRNIIMVDPLLGHEEARQELVQKIEGIIADNPLIEDKVISFKFDFGNGPEDVKVELVTKHYPYSEDRRTEDDYDLPEEIGAAILYAPAGVIIDDSKVRERLTDGGVIINEYTVTKKDGESVDMGN